MSPSRPAGGHEKKEGRYAEGQREATECRKCGQPCWIVYHGPQANHTLAPRAVEAFLASLCEELPGQAVEAAAFTYHVGADSFEDAIRAFLAALREQE